MEARVLGEGGAELLGRRLTRLTARNRDAQPSDGAARENRYQEECEKGHVG